MKTVWLINTMV